jgi:hypothetical protein
LDTLAFRKMEEVRAVSMVCKYIASCTDCHCLLRRRLRSRTICFSTSTFPNLIFPSSSVNLCAVDCLSFVAFHLNVVIVQEPATHNPTPVGLATPLPGPTAPVLININADPHLWAVLDHEISRTNPVEDKHRRLVRSHRSGPLDRDLKPNARIRDELNVVSIRIQMLQFR